MAIRTVDDADATLIFQGNQAMLIYPPLESNYKKDNNYSLAALVSYGEVNSTEAINTEEEFDERKYL